MRRNRIFLVLSAATVVTLFLVQSRDRSPGPLTPTHAAVPELVGVSACDACHGEFGVPSPAACGACHETVRDQVAAGTGFHGGVEAPLRGECGECHREHHGDAVRLVGADAFARAGVADRDAFDHAGLEFGLAGRHHALACGDCHPNADRDFLRAGEKRFLGRTGACTECHDDPHRGSFGTRCASCHGQELPFAETAEFRHPDAFPLTGAHGRVDCESCHEPGTANAVGASTNGPRPVRRCVECHAADAAAVALPDHSTPGFPETCADCHGTEAFAGATFRHTDRFALVGGHAGVSCRACHTGPDYRATPADCYACHEDDFRRAARPDHARQGFPRDCRLCHDFEAFRPSLFRHRFPLETGKHRRLACADCHTRPADFRSFTCTDCHEHARGEMAKEHREVRGYAYDSAACYRCHPTGDEDEAERDD